MGKPKERRSAQAGQKNACRFALPCFNSSGAKMSMGLSSLLEQAAEDGNDVPSTRACGVGDHMRERGETFAEGLDATTFELQFLESP